MTESATPEGATTAGKRRHGCLTAWLLFGIGMNALVVVYYVAALMGAHLRVMAPPWALLLLIAVGAMNILCLAAIYRWKKWGFWGLLALALGIFAFNLYLGISLLPAILGLAGPAILFGVLNIGDANKGWTQLE